MRAPLMWALAAVLSATLWLGQRDDDAGVEPVRRTDRPSDQRPAQAPGAQSEGRPAHRVAEAGSRAAAPPTEAAHLLSAVARWQQRSTSLPAVTLAAASVSAWRGVAPPPPPAPVAEAQPPPQAPAFPHRWLGRYQDAVAAPPPDMVAAASSQGAVRPRQRAIIAGPVSTWVVAEGELIEGQWRVDRIEDRSLRLTYLPLMQQQTLTMR